MVERPFWQAKVLENWRKAPIVWLSGVRRAGKTTLSKAFPRARHLNCDLPSTLVLLEDPEAFFKSLKEPELVLDEVHQLPDPSRVLKIAADEFPRLKVLATGSSTLAATQKFRDTLTGRKREVTLLPVLLTEMEAFGIGDIRERLFRGGLPQALLEEEGDEAFYAEWLDSYYARDVQELFKVEKRTGFLKLLETLLRQSGGQVEAVSLAKMSGLSRPTVLNYLEVLQLTHAIHLLRPFHGGGKQEIVRQPKAYGFDTGFVRYSRGWRDLRDEDCGPLWEHVILDLLLTLPVKEIHYWRNKRQQEIDFVIPRGRGEADAIECKWRSAGADYRNFAPFRAEHPKGRNILVTSNQPFTVIRKVESLEVTLTNFSELPSLL